MMSEVAAVAATAVATSDGGNGTVHQREKREKPRRKPLIVGTHR